MGFAKLSDVHGATVLSDRLINVSIRATDRLSHESEIADCQTVSQDCLLKYPILQNSMGSAVLYRPCQPSATCLARFAQTSSSSIPDTMEPSSYRERSNRVGISFLASSLNSSRFGSLDVAHLAEGFASLDRCCWFKCWFNNRAVSTTQSMLYKANICGLSRAASSEEPCCGSLC